MRIAADCSNLFHERRISLNFNPLTTGGALHLGRLNYDKAHHPLGLHKHNNAMEICYLARGRQTYVVNGEKFQLFPGDIFVAFPDEIHSSGGAPEEKSILYWVVFDMNPEKNLLLLPPAEGEKLRNALLSLPKRHFATGKNLHLPLDQAITEFRKNGEWSNSRIRNCLAEFLINIVEIAGKSAENTVNYSQPVAEAIAYMQKNLGHEVWLPVLAEAANLSVSRFKQKFKQEVGIPPGEYFLRRKIGAAEEMLRKTSRNVTEISFMLGFSSSQYFATVFKRFNAMSPLEFRKSCS
jgi:AraC-like DNA-binding protein